MSPRKKIIQAIKCPKCEKEGAVSYPLEYGKSYKCDYCDALFEIVILCEKCGAELALPNPLEKGSEYFCTECEHQLDISRPPPATPKFILEPVGPLEMEDFIDQAGYSLYELIIDSIENFVHSREYETLQKKHRFDTDKLRFELFSISKVALFEILKDLFSSSATEFLPKIWDKIINSLRVEGNLDAKSLSALESYAENRVSHLKLFTESMPKEEFCKFVGEFVEDNVVGKPSSFTDLAKGVSAFFVVVKIEATKMLIRLKLRKSAFMTPAEKIIARLAKQLFQASVTSADAVVKACEEKKIVNEISDLQYRLITLEFLYFFLSWADKHAFKELGVEKRNSFIDLLVEKTNKVVITKGSQIAPRFNPEEVLENNISFKGINVTIYNQRGIEYDKFTRIYGEDWTLLFSALGGNVAKVVGDNPEIWMLSGLIAADMVTNLNVLDCLRKVKKHFG